MFPRFHDSINFIKKSSFKKVRKALRLFFSYRRSKKGGGTIIKGMPSSIAIEPTTSCNLRCPECPSGLRSFTRDTGMLDKSFFSKMIDELAPTLSNLTFYFQGEPYLNPDFLDMVDYASGQKIYTTTSTNAHYLDIENAERTVKSGLDRLIISLDGVTQETYEQYRIGGKLDKVLEGTRNILKAKKKVNSKTPFVRFQFLVVKPNEHEIERAKQLAKEIGVDEIVFKTAQIYDYKNGSSLIPENTKYSRYKKLLDGTFAMKNPLKNECWKMWHSCVVTWDGLLVPCCFDKDAKHVLGDLKENTFNEVWQGEKYVGLRQSIIKNRKGIDICTNCTEGMKIFE